MADSSTPAVVIAGAGVLGLAVACALLDRGYGATVLDPAPAGPNASSVAAGLLSPIGEAVFDAEAISHFPLLQDALAHWDTFAARAGIALVDAPTLVPATMAATVAGFGPVSEVSGAVSYLGDRRVADPTQALARLRERVLALGGRIEPHPLTEVADANWTVLAPGPGAARLAEIAPELAHLFPVKGQIAVLPNGPMDGPVHRWPGGYLVPQKGGARAGATMEFGRSDVLVEPEMIHGLATAAAAHVCGLDVVGAYGLAGVRMATPDGLPMVGPSSTAGTLIAAGARRNGWLLAPLVGQIIAAYVMGEDPGPWAQALHPGRFGPPT